MRDKIVVLVAGGRMVQDLQQAALSEEELAELLPEELKNIVSIQKWSVQPTSNTR